jgi:hypothetical protein
MIRQKARVFLNVICLQAARALSITIEKCDTAQWHSVCMLSVVLLNVTDAKYHNYGQHVECHGFID